MIRHTAKKCIRYAKTYVHPSMCRSYYTSSISPSSWTSGISCKSISLMRYFSMDPYEMNAAYQDSYYGNNYSDLIDSIENN